MRMLLPWLAVLTVGRSFAAALDWDVYSDTWEATDALGRALPGHAETGPPREGKFVGIFYFLWLGAHGQAGPFNIPKILAEHPDAMKNPDHEAWGPAGAFHHWEEPLFGFYTSDDSFVLEKHARMLADAGVDAVFFDVTNQATYKDNYMALCEAWARVRKLGSRTPQIAFLCPFWEPGKVAGELHRDLYVPGLHEDLWFRWEGKPLILADPEKVDESLRDFFTFRKPVASYFTGPDAPNQWGWLEVHPQHVFRNEAGEAEQMTVGVAQNAAGGRLAAFSEEDTRGRSFHDGKQDESPDAAARGLNFAEQWQRALHVDPAFIFITGWNEWVAMRLNEFNGVREPVMFVDQFTAEKSRDIEPVRGGFGDNYYYQMIANIRRFKGARPQEPASAAKSIVLDGRFDEWLDVGPEFRNHAGSPVRREHKGWGDSVRFVNRTGRNDLLLMKVARDDEYLYFYARTGGFLDLTPAPHWMMLFIDVDRDKSTGWEGYDFVLNRPVSSPNVAVLERCAGGWNWERVADLRCAPQGRELELAIPRQMLGLEEGPIDIEFKWADNMVREGDVMSFWTNGDAAPPGRFNYRYFEAPEPAESP